MKKMFLLLTAVIMTLCTAQSDSALLITIAGGGNSIRIPSTWTGRWSGDDSTAGNSIEISNEDGSICLSTWETRMDTFDEVIVGQHQLFLFDDGSPGAIVELDDGINFYHRDAFVVAFLKHDGNSELFTNNEDLIMSVVKSLTTQVDMENTYPSEVFYKGFPISWFYDSTIADVTAAFGSPSEDDYYEGGRYYGYNGVAFFFDENTEKITYIWAWNLGEFEIDGVTLEKNRGELIEIFGMPNDEGLSEDEYGDIDGYYIRYELPIYSMSIGMPSPDDIANEINIGRNWAYDEFYDDGPGDDDLYVSHQSEQTRKSSQQEDSVYVLSYPSKERSSHGEEIRTASGVVYSAPLDFMTSSLVKYVNIVNPEKVRYGCRIRILTEKWPHGLYKTYTIGEDGRPMGNRGGRALDIVDAIVID